MDNASQESINLETVFSSEGLTLPRVIDLSIEEERQILNKAAEKFPSTLALIETYLKDYLTYFPEDHWRKLYPAGLINVPIGKNNEVFTLDDMLRVTKALTRLKPFAGFAKLTSGFRSPSKVVATVFEALVAEWCAARSLTESLVFSPPVGIKDGVKHPEFLWRTKLGNIYCECKNGRELENKFGKRVDKLFTALKEAYLKYEPWDPSRRLDVRIESSAKNDIEKRIRNVVAQASAAFHANNSEDKTFEEGEVRAVLGLRKTPLPAERSTVRVRLMPPSEVPIWWTGDMAHENTCLSLTVSTASVRRKMVKDLLKDARTQLPPNQLGAVFIQLGGGDDALQDLSIRLRDPAYRNTPWVSLWINGKLHSAVWRDNQPLDSRLLVPAED